MFCRQCEQTAKGEGCTIRGVCGKKDDTAVLQDHLIYGLKSLAATARKIGIEKRDTDLFLMEGLFTTVTNVSFDSSRIAEMIQKAYRIKEETKNSKEPLSEPADWKPVDSLTGLIEQGRKVGILADPGLDKNIRSLREILLYGMKGMAAYANHAFILGKEDREVSSFFYKGLSALTDNRLGSTDLVNLIMEFGKVNLKCMEILDVGHNEHFGPPAPTRVFLGVRKGPAIIVSGHDLLDLEILLEQTAGTGVNVYTHGEMLPGHGYPGLKKHHHLIGHFGTAWQNQQKEFDNIPAAILMTTNCLQAPRPSYLDKIFTTGLVAWPGVPHIEGKDGKKDFSPVLKKAQALGGFERDTAGKEILVGFGHKAVLGLAPQILAAVKAGKIRHFFLIGGCDGAKTGRNYYTELAQKVPRDCVILTLACGKFRFNYLEFGSIDGIPRLLDCGQCNDAYSAIKIASGLADALSCTVNDLPLSLILSWYEQKAVCILLTLLALGIKNIRLGPTLPAFVTPDILQTLAEKFGLKPISTPEADLKAILG